MAQTENLHLTLLEAGQAQKHVTVNEALRLLDAVVQLAVASVTATPPGTPVEGERHIVGAGASGLWSGHDGDIALRRDGAWTFIAPKAGFVAFNRATGRLLFHNAGGWIDLFAAAALDEVARVGIATTADATNRLAVRAPAVLHTAVYAADGGSGDAQHKVNKETAGDSASLLFQTGFSGRAELGLTGDDQLRVKLSADGATFHEAMTLALSGSAGLVGIGAPAPATLLHVDSANAPGAAGSPSILVTGNANKERFELRSAGATPGPTFQGKGYRGTIAAPAATQSGDRLFGLAGSGHDGTGLVALNAAILAMEASENWSAGAHGSEMSFRVTPNGAPTSAGSEALRIQNTGRLKFSAAAHFSANGSVTTALSALGPSGANATVQEWLTITNAAGVTRYVPCF
jgi:hypothetical protein